MAQLMTNAEPSFLFKNRLTAYLNEGSPQGMHPAHESDQKLCLFYFQSDCVSGIFSHQFHTAVTPALDFPARWPIKSGKLSGRARVLLQGAPDVYRTPARKVRFSTETHCLRGRI